MFTWYRICQSNRHLLYRGQLCWPADNSFCPWRFLSPLLLCFPRILSAISPSDNCFLYLPIFSCICMPVTALLYIYENIEIPFQHFQKYHFSLAQTHSLCLISLFPSFFIAYHRNQITLCWYLFGFYRKYDSLLICFQLFVFFTWKIKWSAVPRLPCLSHSLITAFCWLGQPALHDVWSLSQYIILRLYYTTTINTSLCLSGKRFVKATGKSFLKRILSS